MSAFRHTMYLHVTYDSYNKLLYFSKRHTPFVHSNCHRPCSVGDRSKLDECQWANDDLLATLGL